MNYLLGDEALYAFLIGRHEKSPSPDHLKFRDWAKGLSAQDFHFASRMSVAMLYAGVERISNAAKRESRRQAIESKLAQFKDSLLEIDEVVLTHWATVRASLPDNTPPREKTSVSSEQMIEIATAVAFGYVYVTRLTEDLKSIQPNFAGLEIVDPWK